MAKLTSEQIREINIKIVDWLGYKIRNRELSRLCGLVAAEVPPDGIGRLIDFPHSMDDCLELVVPKLYKQGLSDIKFSYYWPQVFCVIQMDNFAFKTANAENEPLAFCLAVEQMIDSKEGR